MGGASWWTGIRSRCCRTRWFASYMARVAPGTGSQRGLGFCAAEGATGTDIDAVVGVGVGVHVKVRRQSDSSLARCTERERSWSYKKLAKGKLKNPKSRLPLFWARRRWNLAVNASAYCGDFFSWSPRRTARAIGGESALDPAGRFRHCASCTRSSY